jgi:hypothetical protein
MTRARFYHGYTKSGRGLNTQSGAPAALRCRGPVLARQSMIAAKLYAATPSSATTTSSIMASMVSFGSATFIAQ